MLQPLVSRPSFSSCGLQDRLCTPPGLIRSAQAKGQYDELRPNRHGLRQPLSCLRETIEKLLRSPLALRPDLRSGPRRLFPDRLGLSLRSRDYAVGSSLSRSPRFGLHGFGLRTSLVDPFLRSLLRRIGDGAAGRACELSDPDREGGFTNEPGRAHLDRDHAVRRQREPERGTSRVNP